MRTNIWEASKGKGGLHLTTGRSSGKTIGSSEGGGPISRKGKTIRLGSNNSGSSDLARGITKGRM